MPLVARLPRVAALDSTGWHSLGAILWGSSAPGAEEKMPHLPACRNSPTGTLWQGLSYIRWRMWGLGLQHGGHIEGWQELCLDVGIRGILEDLRPAFRSFPVVRRSSLLFISHPRNPSATWFTASLHATLPLNHPYELLQIQLTSLSLQTFLPLSFPFPLLSHIISYDPGCPRTPI